MIMDRRADPKYRVPDWNAGAGEVYTWDTPANRFPTGTYILRVEVHRENQVLHFARHDAQIYIDR